MAAADATVHLTPWIKVSDRLPDDRDEVDVWMEVYASPRSMGWADSFTVQNAYRKDGKWFHRTERGEEKELYADYITHWVKITEPVHD
jgi:hypothetical protein